MLAKYSCLERAKSHAQTQHVEKGLMTIECFLSSAELAVLVLNRNSVMSCKHCLLH